MSGLIVDRDMMGTMANTLLLIYSCKLPYNQLINMDMVAIEVIQSLSGSLAVILTVPLIAYLSSRLIPAWDNLTKVRGASPTAGCPASWPFSASHRRCFLLLRRLPGGMRCEFF